MWKEIRPALRNALMTICLVGSGLLVYNVLILRGRAIEWHDFDRPNWTFRSMPGKPEPAAYQLPLSDGSYTIRLLADGRYERRLKNKSIMPYLVMMYESKDWEYQLPTSKLFRYAQRYSLTSPTSSRIVDSGIGFDCGSGLGHSLIRPVEGFSDTISREALLRQFSVHDFVDLRDKKTIVDKFTQEVYGEIEKFDGDNHDKLLELMPNDSLCIRLYLPVEAWTNLSPGRFLSNPIRVRRRELLYLRD